MFQDWYRNRRQDVTGWFKDLHRHPEVGFEETRTSAFVAQRLRDMGLEPVTGIAGTGVVATLHGAKGKGRTIGLRAELDALPMTEDSGLPYASTITGCAHGCGHDGHTTTLLATAAYLSEHPDFFGSVRFIFQPAEELLTGAATMIAEGLFDRFPCDEIYALHNMPGLAVGTIGVPVGAAMASADAIDLIIHADGTHASAPHTGADGVLAACAFITSLQQVSTRVIDARRAGVVSFGVIQGGSVRNILPATVTLQGTLRTNDATARERLIKSIHDVARATEIAHSVKIDVEVRPMAPIAINDATAAEAVVAAADHALGSGRAVLGVDAIMASEDFAFMLEQVTGAFFFVGQDGPYPHHPKYAFDPDLIPTGAAVFIELVKSRGQRINSSTVRSATLAAVNQGE
jgi:amidohydrolase